MRAFTGSVMETGIVAVVMVGGIVFAVPRSWLSAILLILITLLFGSYLLLIVAVLAGAAPWLALLAFASLPLAPPIIRRFRATTIPAALHPAGKGIARLHLVQGSLYALGVAVAALV